MLSNTAQPHARRGFQRIFLIDFVTTRPPSEQVGCERPSTMYYSQSPLDVFFVRIEGSFSEWKTQRDLAPWTQHRPD